MQTMRSYFRRITDSLRRTKFDDWIILGTGLVLALLVRLSLHDYYTRDYSMFTRCYLTIKELGFSAFKAGCTNYTPFYEYLLYLETVLFPKMTNTAGTKLPLIGFDFICAWICFLIVRMKFKTGPIPYFAMFAILFSPPIILVSAGWAQFDIIYTTFLVACVYFILKDKGWLACLVFGIAISIKLQAVALAPFLLILFLKKKISFQSLLLIPGIYILSILPAWIAGRSLVDLLTIYVRQTNLFDVLTLTAPNLYYWIPDGNYDQFYLTALCFGAGMIFLFTIAAYKSRSELNANRIVLLAMISSIIVPYFLPKMHERYFFPALVLSFVFGFFYPKYFYIPIVVSVVSYFSYQQYLFQTTDFSFSVLALVLLVVILILVKQLIKQFYPPEEVFETNST